MLRSTIMQEIPVHGPLKCTLCFDDPISRVANANGWRLVNDPGYWGSSDPIVLVLGQSKGNKQIRHISAGQFNAVAFADIRQRLARILAKISLNLDALTIDKHFTENEKDFAFASLLRCSLSDVNGKTSGSPVMHAMGDPEAGKWIESCMKRWLTIPNPRLRVVVLLGLTDGYVKGVMARLQKLHTKTFQKINKVTVEAAGVIWVFAQHPSTISENHYRRWVGDQPSAKRDLVRDQITKLNLKGI